RADPGGGQLATGRTVPPRSAGPTHPRHTTNGLISAQPAGLAPGLRPDGPAVAAEAALPPVRKLDLGARRRAAYSAGMPTDEELPVVALRPGRRWPGGPGPRHSPDV